MPAPLDGLRVARPCSADWAAMDGDARVRHCGLCRRSVHDLSDLTEAEALRLVREAEGRLCVRFSRRADGAVLTRDGPIPAPGPTSRGRQLAMAAALAGALAASDVVIDRAREVLGGGEPATYTEVMGELELVEPTPEEWTMGLVAPPIPPPPPPPPTG